MTEEIKARDWKTFCERVSAMHAGQPVTIEFVETNGNRRQIASASPLRNVVLSRKDECNDAITVTTEDGVQHEVLEPIHIILKSNGAGGFNPVQIDGETGTTLLTLRPAIKDAVLEGFEK